MALVGVLDLAATGLFAVASTEGLLSVVAVVGALYPVATVLLARAVLKERIRRIQGFGVALAFLGVALGHALAVLAPPEALMTGLDDPLAAALALAALAFADRADEWTVLGFTFALGVGSAFSAPAQQALIGSLVPPRDLPSAVALNSMTFNLARATGPALAALAVATIVIGFGSGGGGDPSSQQDGARPAERPRASEQNRKKPKQRAESEQPAPQAEQPEQQAPAAPAPAPAPAPEEDQPEEEQTAASGPAEGARLNNQGFQLMSEGRYDEAIPILQQAVDSFPQGTSDLNHAYALFNLGQALRLAGRPEEAIPILQQRLEIPNQTGVVRRELELARRAAGRD
jgi:tetratricopeptide (TPR) repeat protein